MANLPKGQRDRLARLSRAASALHHAKVTRTLAESDPLNRAKARAAKMAEQEAARLLDLATA